MADPDFPVGVSFGHVHGRWIEAVGDGGDSDSEPDANPLNGSVIFTPSVAAPGVVKIGNTGMAVRSVTVPIVDGVLDCWLVASDDPDINPTGLTWSADIRFDGGGGYKFSFTLAAGADVDLILATAVPGTGGQWITQGPAGPSAYQIAVDHGFVGTEAEWISSLQGEPGADSTIPGPPGEGVAAGGTTGQVLAKTSGANYATGWINPPQTTPPPDVQTYLPTGAAGSQTSYTWTKPAGARMVHVMAWAAGGGGGSGRRGAAGTVRCGGGGGGAGGVINMSIPAALLPATMPVKVGKGASGGAAVTADDTNGIGGGGGGSSLTTPGGAGGAGGTYGAGGGGGGASVNGQPSGAGGNGGDGIAIIITTF